MKFNEKETEQVLGTRLRVKFDEDDWSFVSELAEERAQSYLNQERSCRDTSTVDAHRTGVAGELAVARTYGLSLDTNVYEDGDGGFDLVNSHESDDKEPEYIDVKTRTRMDARLIVAEKTLQRENSDVFLLVTVSKTFADLVGCASLEDLRHGKLVRRDSQKYRALSQDELRELPGVR
ncbi:hypothetical protein [Halococcus salsus]|uniref:hypothetical protein n=1 Tax=Halococcus salsus TaxID=2162894 RepID=UPI001358DF85|nr:hypothetical protein [Halococcus salsus]